MLVDVDWVSESMTDVRLLIHGLFKVATLIHIWWIEAPGDPSDCLCVVTITCLR